MNDLKSDSAADRFAGLQLFALSFTALFLELMLIRWVPAVVRLVAYYVNLMLISSFLGLGVGALLTRRWKRSFFAWFPVLLVVDVGVLLASQTVLLPTSGHEARFSTLPVSYINYLVLVGIFISNAALFLPIGQRIGQLFEQLLPLRGYAWDLGGSLCGTVCFGAFSLLHFSPVIGVVAVAVIYLVFLSKRSRFFAGICFCLTIGGVLWTTDPHSIWSPYHYISVYERSDQLLPAYEPPPNLTRRVNPPVYFVAVGRDFYQQDADLDDTRYSAGGSHDWMARMHEEYLLPYRFAQRLDRVAIMGAGGGMDVQAALMSGAKHVDAVEIDPTLVDISRHFNSSAIYERPEVTIHINDARAFLQSTKGGYDLIAFGRLDSQSLFSSMSNVRIDGFIYTIQSLRTAFSKLADDGTLVVSFVQPVPWLGPKLEQTIREATGVEPTIYKIAGTLVIFACKGHHLPMPEKLGNFEQVKLDTTAIDLPTDNWPFLYLSRKTIPSDYLSVIITLAVLSIIAVAAVRGTSMTHSDGHFFFMGLAFLLLQTKSITDCSLYFGTTWLVTTIVICGVLLMVLLANLVSMRWLRHFSFWLYVPLFAALLLLYVVPRDDILGQPYAFRMAWALLIVPLPIFFAGLIFSTTFRAAPNPSISFGSNLIGATIGGFCEYLGMALGSNALSLIVMAAYVASLVLLAWGNRRKTSFIPATL